MKKKGVYLCQLLMLASLLLTFFHVASAQVEALHIDDNANVISKSMETKLTQLLVDTEKEHQFHIEVVVLPHLYGKPANAVVNAYYQNMIKNTPGISRSALLLITLDQEFIQLITTPNIVRVFLYPSQMNFRRCWQSSSHNSHVFCIHSCCSRACRLAEKSSAVGRKACNGLIPCLSKSKGNIMTA
jgi:hypothetical protein